MGAPVFGVIEGENVIRLVPEYDDEAWQNVVIVNFNRDNRQVNVNANDRSNDNSDYSVPVLRESSSRSSDVRRRVAFYPSDLIHPPSIRPTSCSCDSICR